MSDLRDCIAMMAAAGKRVDEIREHIKTRWPHYTQGQVAGAFTKARRAGVVIEDSPRSAAARAEQERRRCLRSATDPGPSLMRERIKAMAAEGMDAGQIRRGLQETEPGLTRGRIAGVIDRLRRDGTHIGSNARGMAAQAMNAARSPEYRKEIGSKGGLAAAGKHTVSGAAAVESARERSATAWPAQAGDHRTERCRPKNTLGLPAAAPAEPARPRFGVLTCSWVDGDRRPWILCEKRALFGVPFCEAHAKVGLERRRPARETAEAVPQ